MDVSKSCFPSEYESNWGVMVVVEASDMSQAEYLNVKLVIAHD